MIAQVDLIVICGIFLTQKERLAKAASAEKSGMVSLTRISRFTFDMRDVLLQPYADKSPVKGTFGPSKTPRIFGLSQSKRYLISYTLATLEYIKIEVKLNIGQKYLCTFDLKVTICDCL